MQTSDYFEVMQQPFTTADSPDETDYRRALDSLQLRQLPDHTTEIQAAIAQDEAGRTYRMRAYTSVVGHLNVWVDVLTGSPPEPREPVNQERELKLLGCARFSWDPANGANQSLHRELAEAVRDQEAANLNKC